LSKRGLIFHCKGDCAVPNRDTETIANRRYLTEEFLSDCADLKVKPSWWKEFIASIRCVSAALELTALQKVLKNPTTSKSAKETSPAFSHLTFSKNSGQ
jgi:hypothetical protein